MVSLKGKVGGGRSRRYSKGLYRAARGMTKADAQWFTGTYGNASHDSQKINLLWRPGTAADNLPQRLCSVNADSLGEDQVGQGFFLKRLIWKFPLLAQVGQTLIVTERELNNQNARQSVPFHEGGERPGVNAVYGPLLDGDLVTGTLQGAQSWAEGVPVAWALMYETATDASLALSSVFGGTFDPYSPASNTKNKRIFAQGVLTPSVYSPKTITIDKRFPGKGVRLSNGDREIYQVTLAIWGFNSGTTLAPGLAFAPGENRFMYYQD